MSKLELAIQFFLQLAVILGACLVVGRIARRFGQPQVVGEMIAGVVLGPSLLGWWLPGLGQALFPPESMNVLYPVSQLGLALYMFVVGLEFRMDIVRSRMGASAAVSIAGMAAPFLLGGLLALALYHHTPLFPESVSAGEAAIFLGACLCITAFPMLARIIHFKGLTGTTMGTVAIGAGAIDDAAAWCLLAVVLASFDGNVFGSWVNLAGGLGYVIVVFGFIRPGLSAWGRRVEQRGALTDAEFVFCLVLLSLGACWTDWIGLHAVFGAFMMGAALPRGTVSRSLVERIQPLTVALLLPLFFAYSGLNTQITLLNSWTLWGIAFLILLASVAGKGVACWLAARACGLENREALGIGTLMNARGLMELIIINIGLQRGIISPELFACLVIMAIVTTLMASPLFDLLSRKRGH